MLTVKDLAWAAGFLEGEGYFTVAMGPQGRASGVQVGAFQVQREPLERLHRMFGGSLLSAPKDKERLSGINARDGYVWRVCAGRAAGVAMTLFGMLSPRRQSQAARMIEHWRAIPLPGAERRANQLCKRGHVLDISRADGRRACSICRRARARDARQKRGVLTGEALRAFRVAWIAHARAGGKRADFVWPA